MLCASDTVRLSGMVCNGCKRASLPSTYWSRRNVRVSADLPTAPSPTMTIDNFCDMLLFEDRLSSHFDDKLKIDFLVFHLVWRFLGQGLPSKEEMLDEESECVDEPVVEVGYESSRTDVNNPRQVRVVSCSNRYPLS